MSKRRQPTVGSLHQHRTLAAELEAERARLIAAQAVAKVGSWETDVRTFDVTWSEQTHRIFGTDPRTFTPTHDGFLAIVHPDDREAVDAAFRNSFDQDAPQSTEHRIVPAPGVIKIVEERWQVVRDSKGAPATAIGTCQDITERKMLEQQFLRAQRMESVGTLAGGIAHDLNNVLTPILMSVELLRDKITDPEDLALLSMVEESAERGADLVRQVLTFARGVEGERAAVDAVALVRDLLKVMRDTFPKSIVVAFDPPSSLQVINGDRTQIHQVALNLLVNARDAMPDGGVLTLALEDCAFDDTYCAMNPDSRPGRYVRLRVSDTGTGIPAHIRDRIFEPFFTTKDLGNGTGLGLSTTLAIVKSHGGFIRLTSEVGVGTTFDVHFPASVSDEAGIDSGFVRVLRAHGRGECILVVDDEPAIRDVARRILEWSGYRVLLAANGAEAVSLYAQHAQDVALVVTDMAMPVMDGASTIIAIRSMDPRVKVIAASGLVTHTAIQAAAAGVNEFVPKPYTADDLLSAVQRVLGAS